MFGLRGWQGRSEFVGGLSNESLQLLSDIVHLAELIYCLPLIISSRGLFSVIRLLVNITRKPRLGVAAVLPLGLSNIFLRSILIPPCLITVII